MMKVLLVDDHAVVRAGFKMLLSAQPFIDEISSVDRGELVVHEYERLKPDVVVMDLSMPGIGGLEAIRRLIKQDKKAVVLVYSIHEESIYVERAIQAGAMGYVSKNSAPEILSEAVQKVVGGEQYIEADLILDLSETALQPEQANDVEQHRQVVNLLSPREFDVLCLVAKGLTVHDAAKELHLSYKTVANYNTQIKHKLSVNTAAELAHVAIMLGIIKH